MSDRELLSAATTTRNNTSVVTKFTYHERSILMTGDVEFGAWEVIRDAWLNLSADLMKVAYHRSINASPEWGYEVVFPARSSANQGDHQHRPQPVYGGTMRYRRPRCWRAGGTE